MEEWRIALHAFADEIAASFAGRPDVLGVAIGGSVGRGTEWEHSDVEIGLLVAEKLPDVPHFHVAGGRGFETLQIVAPKIAAQLDRIDAEPHVVAEWPLQLFECRIVHDPTGLLGRFKRAFDARLFTPTVQAEKVTREIRQVDKWLMKAHDDVAAGRPASAVARARQAMNHLLLAFYTSNGLLPRSQNRCESLLRDACARLGRPDVHATFVSVYGLEGFDLGATRDNFRAARADIDRVAVAWGEAAPAFFRDACDGDLAWGHAPSILAVHRLCLPHCVRAIDGELALDDVAWRREHAGFLRVLGLDDALTSDAMATIDRVEQSRRTLVG